MQIFIAFKSARCGVSCEIEPGSPGVYENRIVIGPYILQSSNSADS